MSSRLHIVRLLIASLSIALATLLAQRVLMGAALPLLETGCNFLRHEFLTRLRLEAPTGLLMIHMYCTAVAPIRLGADRWIPPHADFDGGAVHALHVLVPFVLFLTTVSAWPFSRWRELIPRAGFAAAVAVPAILLPSVLLLVGRITGEIVVIADGTDAAYANGWVQAMLFMEMCGAWLMPILSGCLVGIAAQRCSTVWTPER